MLSRLKAIYLQSYRFLNSTNRSTMLPCYGFGDDVKISYQRMQYAVWQEYTYNINEVVVVLELFYKDIRPEMKDEFRYHNNRNFGNRGLNISQKVTSVICNIGIGLRCNHFERFFQEFVRTLYKLQSSMQKKAGYELL